MDRADTGRVFERALWLQEEQRYDEAIELYRRIVDSFPEACGALANLGYCLNMIDRNREAVSFLIKAIECGEYKMKIDLGYAYYKLGMYDHALIELIAVNNFFNYEDDVMHYYTGMCYFKKRTNDISR